LNRYGTTGSLAPVLQHAPKICYNEANGGDEATNAYVTSRTDSAAQWFKRR
jgi:hypothetical protein